MGRRTKEQEGEKLDADGRVISSLSYFISGI
jgi:hypothetical protein